MDSVPSNNAPSGPRNPDMNLVIASVTSPLLILILGGAYVMAASRGECVCFLCYGLITVVVCSVLSFVSSGGVALLFRKSIRSWRPMEVLIASLPASACSIAILYALCTADIASLESRFGWIGTASSYFLVISAVLVPPMAAMTIAKAVTLKPKHQNLPSDRA